MADVGIEHLTVLSTGESVPNPRHLERAGWRMRRATPDGLHKFTTRLAREYGIIMVEDLRVAGMLRNRRLARRVADAGFGGLRRQLAYKTGWNGGRLVVVR